MVNFGKKLHVKNYLLTKLVMLSSKKPATKGFENKKTVVMQSHLDMVHQKNSETVFDFETQGIKMHHRWRLGYCRRNYTRSR